MDLHVGNTIQWSADGNADHYHLKLVPLGALANSTRSFGVETILDHTSVAGAVVNLTAGGLNSIPASALLVPNAVLGTDYDIYIRGVDASGNGGPWSLPLDATYVVDIDTVIDLTII